MKKDIVLSSSNDNDYSFRYIRSFTLRHRRLTERQKYILETYWPPVGVEFDKQILSFTSLFGRYAATILEIGFGSGESLITMAKKCPEQNFLGIEVYLPGISACLFSIHQEDIKNVRIINHDAIEVLYKMIPENSLDMINLFFPDPWKKTRHNKRRIVQLPFAKLIKSRLKLGGIFHTATDWKPYAEHILKVMSLIADYKNCSVDNNSMSYLMSRPETKFEQRSYRLGYNIWDLMFKRIK